MASIRREKNIIAVMIGLYCRKHHGRRRGELCDECRDLLEYSDERLMRCPFAPDKPPCRECKVHCYKPEYRQRVREVMRFSGPRILFHHPIEWLKHRFAK